MFKAKAVFSKIQVVIRKYVEKNWGFPFIVVFLVLLFSAAVFLSIGLSSLAESISVYAYFILVAGVVLQLVYILRNRGRNGEVVLDGSN